MIKNLLLILSILGISLLSVQLVWPAENDALINEQFSDKANLALRQAGHQLLRLAGDSSSRIPPVIKKEEGIYMLEVDHKFSYDTLPYLIDAALSDYNIQSDYYVSITECGSDSILLGYNFLSYKKSEISCMGREQVAKCSRIYLNFTSLSKDQFAKSIPLFIFAIPLMLLIVFITYLKAKRSKAKKPSGTVTLGKSIFNVGDQYLENNGVRHSLTYRESKLLQFLASHPNEILERERIVAEVWNDEGVIVGRSLDVFISRLRKLLSEENTVKIKNIHGVGYRFNLNIS